MLRALLQACPSVGVAMMHRFLHVCVVLLCVSAASTSFAQIRSGTIVGKITDISGAAIPQAQVVLRETGTNAVYTLESNSSGEYTQPYLPFGDYEVIVEKPGFRSVVVAGLKLATAQTIRADVQLDVGAIETQVTVTGRTAELQTESSRVQNSVGETVIRAIPNVNNNPLNYAVLQPGVIARAAMNDTQSAQSFGIGTEGRRAFANFQINGGAAFANDIQLDGVSIQASAWNEVAILPNTEGIQEVRTTINNLSAEYGRSQGTVIISTKSGTNQYRGSTQFRLRNEALNANRFANNAAIPTVPKPPFKQQGYSATFGGPVDLGKLYDGRDRTFFFVSYEGMRFKQALDYFRTVPTELERRGDFSRTVALVGTRFVPVQVFDPFTVTQVAPGQWRRAVFPNAVIPPNRLNPVMLQIANEFPLPNRTPDDPRNINNFYNRMIREFKRDAVNTRLDHRFSAHLLYGTFGTNFGSIDSPNGWGSHTRGYVQQGGFFGPINGDRNYYGSIGDTWVIGPTTVADVRIGLTRVAAENRAATFDDLDYASFGMPREWNVAVGLMGAYPELTSFGGGFSAISPLNQTAFLAKIERQTNWNIVGSVTKVVGRWNHKWGGEFRNYLSNYSDARGSFNILTGSGFTSGNIIGPTGNNIDSVTAERSGSGLASYLLGAGEVQAGENGVLLALSAKYFALYQQSDWRVNDRLTLNLGLRYDVQPGPTERFDRLSAFSYRGETQGTRGRLIFPGTEGFGRNLYKTPWKDFGPRIGLAYRLSDTWVARSGFGVTYLPSNTGYFGGPFYYGVQNFGPLLSTAVAGQYGNNPQGRLLAPFNRVNTLIPAIGANRNAPQYYGAGGNEPRFDYDDFHNGKVLQWNIFVERKLGQNYIVQVGYAGTRGYHLPMGRMTVNSDQFLPDSLLNEWRAAYIASNGTNPATLSVPNPFQPNPNQLIPYNGRLGTSTMALRDTQIPHPFFPGNLIGGTVGFNRYNALQLQLQRSFANGLLFTTHYTWSRAKEMWHSESQNNQFAENAGFPSGSLDRRNLKNNYAVSSNDIPHRFVTTAVWQTPFGAGRRWSSRSGIVNGVLGGWNLAGVLLAQSGQPQQGFSGPGGGTITGLRDRVPDVPVEVPQELQRWYTSPNPADRTVTLPSGRQVVVCLNCFLKYSSDAFRGRVVQFPNGTIGQDIYWFGTSAPRYDDVRGNGRFNVNMSLQKEFELPRRARLQFSAEASNVLNNTQFRPNLNLSTGNIFTNLTAAQRAQGIQPGMAQNEAFGTFDMSTFDPRQIELRLRILF